jgi:hypothetical protein
MSSASIWRNGRIDGDRGVQRRWEIWPSFPAPGDSPLAVEFRCGFSRAQGTASASVESGQRPRQAGSLEWPHEASCRRIGAGRVEGQGDIGPLASPGESDGCLVKVEGEALFGLHSFRPPAQPTGSGSC